MTAARKSRSTPNLNLKNMLSMVNNHVRRGTLLALAEGKCDVSTLSELTGAHISVVSHSLRIMRECGVVTSERDSRRRIYQLAPGAKANRRGGFVHIHLKTNDGQELQAKFRPIRK